MTQKNKALIYRACSKAIVYFHGKGINTEHQLDIIRTTRNLLHDNIVQLATKDEIIFPRLLSSLEDAYFDHGSKSKESKREYCVDMMIRDIADICRTLKRMSEGKERSDSSKILIAKTLCDAMYELLK